MHLNMLWDRLHLHLPFSVEGSACWKAKRTCVHLIICDVPGADFGMCGAQVLYSALRWRIAGAESGADVRSLLNKKCDKIRRGRFRAAINPSRQHRGDVAGRIMKIGASETGYLLGSPHAVRLAIPKTGGLRQRRHILLQEQDLRPPDLPVLAT
ncbi:hypothetical protein L798_02538 [Zootermopsis nevadensis]|uniref:Uncharacterized protein n=1 Tax=Zootermopsis nevadensis TaxID=136037 RepID=A0A067QH87_ZOONE|nr:hypothetical protein L798_02538 [Zootermopsis nevadensis]